ncbi:MAG TPA: riboflavin biosynthesis protein RibF [bacterium]
MKILPSVRDDITREAVCVVGGFDGVHRGHQALIQRALELAGTQKKTGVITFDPLPIFVLKTKEIFYLTPRCEKEKLLEVLGLDFIFYIDFTAEFAGLTPESFAKYVHKMIAPAWIVVGENFHFGKDRKGSAKILKDLASGMFEVDIVPKVKDEGTISSTRIRELLLLGNIKAANHLLGREYAIHGAVVKGKGKGTHLGFPTINLQVEQEKLLPLDGVYKVTVLFDNEEHLGGMFCRHGLVEVHIIDFTGDLYDIPVQVRILERIRDIRHFADDAALRTAIARDIKKVSNLHP